MSPSTALLALSCLTGFFLSEAFVQFPITPQMARASSYETLRRTNSFEALDSTATRSTARFLSWESITHIAKEVTNICSLVTAATFVIWGVGLYVCVVTWTILESSSAIIDWVCAVLGKGKPK